MYYKHTWNKFKIQKVAMVSVTLPSERMFCKKGGIV